MILPKHLAIIMDGNGRWARARRHNRFYGHIRGARVAKEIIRECAKLKISHLTLFAFSTENWFRPSDEVSFLMRLLKRQLLRELRLLQENNIRFQCIGELNRMPGPVRETILYVLEQTAQNTGMVLTFALSYGGRQEIARMAQEMVRQARLGLIDESDVDEALVADLIPSSYLPDPDLIIRTSGESRLSNFFLWQAAYSEIEFEKKPWPEFTTGDLFRILTSFSQRERRFGRTSEQISLT